MKVLLDTHTLIWAIVNPAELSARAREVIEAERNVIYVSAASAWEIATKVRLGKLPEAEVFESAFVETVVDVAGFILLSISPEVSLRAGRLRGKHKDPFDRMIAAQALDMDIPIVGIDEDIDVFDVVRIW